MRLRVEDHGTIVAFTPIDDEAKAWWTDNVAEPEPWQRMGGTVYVDRRAAGPIFRAIIEWENDNDARP